LVWRDDTRDPQTFKLAVPFSELISVPDYLRWWDWEGEPIRGVYQAPTTGRNSMRYIFNLNRAGNPAKDENPWHPCRYFNDYIAEHPLPEGLRKCDLKLYNVRRDTHKGSIEAMLKYDLPDEEPLIDNALLLAALSDLKRDFSELEGKCPIKPLANVVINPDGSSGVVFKDMDLKTRQDVLSEAPETIHWFWENAHLVKYPTLWKEFGKVELLKVTKGIRGISCPPVDYHMCTAAMYQASNEALSAIGAKRVDQPFGPGMSLQNGGLNHYVSWLAELAGKMTSSDADKWDARLRRLWFQVSKLFYHFLWDKQGMTEEEWWDRTNYYFDETIFTHLLSSNGQVFLKIFGMPSGSVLTTYLNSIAHILMKYVMFRKLSGLGTAKKAYPIIKRNYRFKVYGDDNNEKISKTYAHLYTYENREKEYALLGVKLSKDKDVESDTPEGHVWLGKTIRWDKGTGTWVGEVNANKVLCSLLNLESKDNEPELIFMRTIALLVEATWTEPLQTYIRAYAHWLYDKQEKLAIEREDLDKWFISVPTHEMCKNFWLGREGRAIHASVLKYLNG